MTFEEHLARWRDLHGGIEPSALVVAWLRLVHVVARRLPVPPDVLTVLAVAAATAALVVSPWWAALLILSSALLDGLDGAVAVLRDRVTSRGALLDAVGDRLCDALFVLALVLAGAPWWLGLAAVLGVLALEGWRHLARDAITVTVAERPTRVLAAALGIVSVPTVGVGLLAAALVAGLGQLAVASRAARRSRCAIVPGP